MLRCSALLLALAATSLARAGEVRLAVAANFSAPMKAIAGRFERDTGHKLLLSFGSTGKFYAQIQHGAPFDVLLAADQETPARLEKEGAAAAGSRFTYAVGQLVLWSAQAGLVDDQGEVLRKGAFARLAIANPKLAPYGAAAVEVLKKRNRFGALAAKLVMGDNIAQTHQFIVSGAATLGFVAMSQVFEEGKLGTGSAWVVPASLHSPIRQDAALLARGRDKPAARAFMLYLQGEKAKAIIRAYGYAAA